MATYAIGDVQGCFDPLMALLKMVEFSAKRDVLWFTGDLVNRGPQSLETLRFVKNLGNRAITVLGNHDLHLLATYTLKKPLKQEDTLAPILTAADCDELCAWLFMQPFLYEDPALNYTLVHAGLYPSWTLPQAKQLAKELSLFLQSDRQITFFKEMYGNTPAIWDENLQGIEKARFLTNVFTRMRFLTAENALVLNYKGTVEQASPDLIPWFKAKARKSKENRIVFGHWAALNRQTLGEKNIYPLDSGCIWGNGLTAMRLEDQQLFHLF